MAGLYGANAGLTTPRPSGDDPKRAVMTSRLSLHTRHARTRLRRLLNCLIGSDAVIVIRGAGTVDETRTHL